MRFLIKYMFLLIFFILSKNVNALETKHINVCGDGGEWPPYHFIREGEIVGYDIDVLSAIFKKENVQLTFRLPPWQRCLQDTLSGVFDIALSASYNEERDRDYLMTEYYYTVVPSYVYSANKYPQGLNITSPQELNSLRMCGLQGYNYLKFGVDEHRVHKLARSFEQLVKMLRSERCDVFLARYEILRGFNEVKNIVHLSDDIRLVTIPRLKPEPFYLLISRFHPEAQRIKQIIDQGIIEMRNNDHLMVMLDQYFIKK
ncbi:MULTISPECIES: transporter substrate-binding domain-containing protein [unclassified Vibrio]|uniref:substrate-binding periplasmic protein n=1 Tax=unclassified Vibrio TaxID=2614977 RepID=UPI001482F7EF|nr:MULTISPECIES: transporter substrate-binding domain-containing protein [unclassified Vibrio]NNN45046.1 amino acid ABC transporter substrate-binding protein [Vibrio sp. 1-1(7)]NNN72419.1 amino acid ABC transporter substrate-binding protein [Vibrio sp. 12-2(3-a)]